MTFDIEKAESIMQDFNEIVTKTAQLIFAELKNGSTTYADVDRNFRRFKSIYMYTCLNRVAAETVFSEIERLIAEEKNGLMLTRESVDDKTCHEKGEPPCTNQ